MESNMNKFVAAIAIALSTMSSAYAASPEVLDAAKAVVQINRDCSGTIIKSERDFKTGDVNTFVLTAKHCVPSQDRNIINVDQYQKNRVVKTDAYVADVYGRSFKSDLALLRLRDKQTAFVYQNDVASVDTPLEWGDDVLTIGYPLGRSKTLTSGTLGHVEDLTGEADFSKTNEFLRATPNVAPGSSGSALLKLIDGEYKIVGILTAAAGRGATHIALYTPLEEIDEYLRIALPKTEEVKKTGQ